MASERGTLSTKILSDEMTHALNQAAVLMLRKRQQVMTAEMLLLSFILTPDVDAHQMLRDFSQERGFSWDQFERDADRVAGDRRRERDIDFDFVTGNNKRIAIGKEVLVILDDGLTLAEENGSTVCTSLHALAMMATIRVGTHWLLNRRGITQQAVLDEITRPAMVSAVTTVHNGIQYYRREKLLQKLTSSLSMMHRRHVMLVGQAGVGKRTLVLSLAQMIQQGDGPPDLKTVVELDERALLDDPLQAVENGLKDARGGVLFVPDIARFFGGLRADFPEAACNALQKAFFSNQVVLIGTATEDAFAKKLEDARPIVEQAQVLRVPPATVEETTAMLNTLKPKFESDYGLTILDASIPEVARLAGRYYTAEPLPGAAIHLLHRSAALIKMSGGGQTQDGKVKDDSRLDPEDVMVATSMLTGVPVTKMGADERDRYVNMVDHLHKRIIGQKEAVLALSRAVKMARVGLKDPKRPIGSFLFLGPTGVGKSELAKALAEFMFGAESALTTFDMSEFMEESSVNRLIGSPPGYIGSAEGGQLTNAIKQKPYSVVLFDEVEKAHLKVFDVLLQVMDEGRLTSGQGETVRFSETVLIMTSNIGGRYLADPLLTEAEAHTAADEDVRAHFRPEFLNRLDDIIYFHRLSDDNLYDIMTLLLKKEVELLKENRELELIITPAAKKWLVAQNEHPEWGARPLRRIIQRHIREPMADFLLEENPGPGHTVKIRVQQGDLLFETE